MQEYAIVNVVGCTVARLNTPMEVRTWLQENPGTPVGVKLIHAGLADWVLVRSKDGRIILSRWQAPAPAVCTSFWTELDWFVYVASEEGFLCLGKTPDPTALEVRQ